MASGSELHKGHRQRLRDRAINEGLDAFNPHQVMELLLFYAIPVQDVSDLAHRLIDRFGSVKGVLNALPEELAEIKGVGKGVIEWMACLREMIDSYISLRPEDRPRLANYRDTGKLIQEKRKGAVPPEVYQLCLAPSGIILMYKRICNSLAWGDSMVLKEALRDVLALQAKNVIIIEYTGPESAGFLEEDEMAAKGYSDTLNAIGVSLMDVVKVSEKDIISMRQLGTYNNTVFQAEKSYLSKEYLQETDDEPVLDLLPDSEDGL